MRACVLGGCALLLAIQLATPAFAQRSSQTLGPELSGEDWAECFAVFTGMATILLAHAGPVPAQGAGEGATGPADHFLALSEAAAQRWLDSQAAGQDQDRLMAGLERAVDRAIRSAAARSDFTAYLQRTSDRCIVAVGR